MKYPFIARVAAVTIGAAIAWAGCSNVQPAAIAQGCKINSDCVSPLVCVFTLCHEACVASRDCALGAICVASGSNKVCELPQESNCGSGAQCPTGLVCGSDSVCRNACSTTEPCTVPDQQCKDGACFDRPDGGGSPTDGGEEAAPPDGESDSGPCPAESTDDTTGIFVVRGASTAADCGSRSNPCGTIDVALSRASGNPAIKSIYVGGQGKYVVATPQHLLSGVSILGGWLVEPSTTWKHNCLPPEIDGPNPVFSANKLAKPVTLSALIIKNTATPDAGDSLYGVTSTDSTLSLVDVSIEVSNTAGNGVAGADVTTMGGGGADGGCSPVADGGPGMTGDAGAPSGNGSFGPMGFTPAQAGTGVPGATGQNGTAAPTPTPITVTHSTCTAPVMAHSVCLDAGMPKSFSGKTGMAGCPGSGGPGGSGGFGGGCNIALYVWGGAATLSGGKLSAGKGGPGGAGGTGGPGGSGAAGVRGASTLITTVYCEEKGALCSTMVPTDAGGTIGGLGGPGGMGGQGAGGTGGCSYAYYAGGSATVKSSSGTSLANAGGGSGGLPNGLTGKGAAHN